MERARWLALMARLGLRADESAYEALVQAYGEPHRHYHTAAHIDDCLAVFDTVKHLAARPDEVEIAIWFHDAVYRPYRSGSEARSADWAARYLAGGGANGDAAARVHDLIMATEHDAPATDGDTRLLVDVDLAILGSDEVRYRRFERDVRREYRWIPGPVFRRARTRILRSFLERDTIYATAPLRERLETAARANLERSLAELAPAGA